MIGRKLVLPTNLFDIAENEVPQDGSPGNTLSVGGTVSSFDMDSIRTGAIPASSGDLSTVEDGFVVPSLPARNSRVSSSNSYAVLTPGASRQFLNE